MPVTFEQFQQLINVCSDINLGILWLFIGEMFLAGIVISSIIAETLNKGE